MAVPILNNNLCLWLESAMDPGFHYGEGGGEHIDNEASEWPCGCFVLLAIGQCLVRNITKTEVHCM